LPRSRDAARRAPPRMRRRTAVVGARPRARGAAGRGGRLPDPRPPRPSPPRPVRRARRRPRARVRAGSRRPSVGANRTPAPPTRSARLRPPPPPPPRGPRRGPAPPPRPPPRPPTPATPPRTPRRGPSRPPRQHPVARHVGVDHRAGALALHSVGELHGGEVEHLRPAAHRNLPVFRIDTHDETLRPVAREQPLHDPGIGRGLGADHHAGRAP